MRHAGQASFRVYLMFVPPDDDRKSRLSVVPAEDCEQLERIYRSEAPKLMRYFRRRMQSLEDPLDLVQEAFARFVGSSAGASLRNPEAYLQRIARNMLIDRSRKISNRAEHVPIETHNEIAVEPDQAFGIEANDVKRLYLKTIDALPPKTRTVFLLHRAEELSYKVIAARLGISIRTVEWHIAEAICRIGKALNLE